MGELQDVARDHRLNPNFLDCQTFGLLEDWFVNQIIFGFAKKMRQKAGKKLISNDPIDRNILRKQWGTLFADENLYFSSEHF